jgi:hypothetical protein
MALAPGTRLGSYEVVARVGAGGMGEVCRAPVFAAPGKGAQPRVAVLLKCGPKHS